VNAVLTGWTSFLHRVGFTRWRFIVAGIVIAALVPSFLRYGTIRPYDFLTFVSLTTFIVATYYEAHHPFAIVRSAMKIVSLLAAVASAIVVVVGWTLLPFNGGGV
jgi:hypothetical protein